MTDITEAQIAETSRDRNAAIKMLRAALRARSGKSWSVTGNRGTSWGWIEVKSPPARAADQWGTMTDAEAAELGELLGLDAPVHHQGVSIPASSGHRHEYLMRALGRTPTVHGETYWD